MTKTRTELEVPEELLNEFDKAIGGYYANRSEAIRGSMRMLLNKLKEGKEKGKLLEGLEEFLKTKLPKPEEKESVRNLEVERFTEKWGTPDYKSNLEVEPPYVNLEKTYRPKSLGDVELEISNGRARAAIVHDQVQRGFGKYNINLYDKNVKPIVDYFKSKGLTIAEENLLQHDVMHYVLKTHGSEGKKRQRELAGRGYQYFGLFAEDKEDFVFIAYREVKPK